MKKRILALVLAATTAFSMFGASLSVSAADAENTLVGGIVKYDSDKGYMDENGVADYATYIDQINAVNDLVVDDSDVAVEDNYLYSYDYTAKSWENFTTALDTALNVEDGTTEYLGKTVYPMYATALVNAAKALVAETGDNRQTTALRAAALDDLYAAKNDVKAMDPTDYVDGETALAAIKADLNKVTAADYTSAVLKALAAYEKAVEALKPVDSDVDPFDALAEQIEIAEGILSYRDEYKTTASANKAFDNLEAKLDAANNIMGDYSVLTSKITKATNELKTAIAKVNTYAIKASANTLKALKAAMDKADACKKDPGYVTTGDSNAVKAFDKAYAAAENAKNASEHVVIDATDALNDAIDGLKVNAAKGSYALAAQERLEAKGAFKKVESDYTPATWAKLESALEAFEAAVTEKEYDEAEKAVNTALDGLVKVSTRAAKAEFKKVMAEAKSLYNDKKGQATKSQAAVNAFKDAYEKADKATPSTVSAYEDLTATMEAAIKAYKENKVVDAYEGWAYDNGTWYFFVKGEKATGWTWDGKNWYYMNDKGVMQTGWQKIDGAWYYLNTWGGMAKGWAKVNNTWYYLNPNGGKMVANGWNWINGKCYYFYASGAMAANTTVNGYKVGADGAWIK